MSDDYTGGLLGIEKVKLVSQLKQQLISLGFVVSILWDYFTVSLSAFCRISCSPLPRLFLLEDELLGLFERSFFL